jgi:hypothetical protein
MSVGKVTFRGVEAPQPQPQPPEQTKVSFQGQEVDEEKSNAAKYMIGAAALAGVVALVIAGYKGHLGEGIQKFLGGAEKSAKDAGKAIEKEGAKVAEDTAGVAEKSSQKVEKLTEEELNNILNKSVKEEVSEEEVIKAFYAKYPDEPGVFTKILMDCIKSLDTPKSTKKVSDAIEMYMEKIESAKFAQRMVENWP